MARRAAIHWPGLAAALAAVACAALCVATVLSGQARSGRTVLGQNAKFGAYASEVKNSDPTSRGFDLSSYVNDDPFAKEFQGNKFNARAVRSFKYLEARAERLQKLIAKLKTETQTKKIDVNLSPRGAQGVQGGAGP
eukprot:CAMPEP_0206251678 /NCGR_PEP_ID=MMETSP0047_2-20121206/22158_1 /ASSEMBLY_ACC=CAM_ASM_000192 /TAXON_ID=195065 /ORGANISM="Chroomonas mesostigmatica_cf, Strain CCMP1168" /LENGTH=136 /DNA_ID=CAMNT_0053677659 /DNA_START=68 /DNA_END=474 /DNA_ORIENTATION=+